MYKSVLEMFGDVEAETNKQKQIELLQSYATNAQFVLFLRYAFFNVRKSTFTQIPLYKPNMIEPTFSLDLDSSLMDLIISPLIKNERIDLDQF